MPPLNLGPVHHIRLTVNDVERSKAFYTDVLGLQVAMDTLPPEDDAIAGEPSVQTPCGPLPVGIAERGGNEGRGVLEERVPGLGRLSA